MTPAEIRSARRALGLSQSELAAALGIRNNRTVRKWEAGENDVPGPAAVAITYLLQGALDETMKRVLPEYVVADDLTDSGARELVVRLWRPRFIAAVTDSPVGEAVEVDGTEYLSVAMWIDAAVGFDVDALLQRAATYFSIYTADSMDAGGT